MTQPDEIVDLQRYPVGDLDAPDGSAVVEKHRRRFLETGLCLLPGFLRPEALSAMAREARELSAEAHVTEQWRDGVSGDSRSGDSTDPRSTRARFGAVAYDRLPAGSPLRALYGWDGLTKLVAAIVGRAELERTVDPLVSCSLSFFRKGDELGWHYDSNEATVSLLLQAADEGGAFEFAPETRGDGITDTAARERAALAGAAENLVSPRLEPGTLSIFDGNRALHRVAPVTGQRERIIALLNYAAEPDYAFSKEVHLRFFGRTIDAS